MSASACSSNVDLLLQTVAQIKIWLACTNSNLICDFISSGKTLLLPPGLQFNRYSSLDTKLSLSYVDWSGDSGWALPSLQWVHSSAKLVTFSMVILSGHCFDTKFTLNSAFKACCRSRGEKLEKTKISYACLARVVRDGGFKIALIARLSAIPGHCKFLAKLDARSNTLLVTTAVFSTCGMGIIVFSFATILSLPKQFITVYLGVILEESGTGW